jgi:hypothetical protein
LRINRINSLEPLVVETCGYFSYNFRYNRARGCSEDAQIIELNRDIRKAVVGSAPVFTTGVPPELILNQEWSLKVAVGTVKKANAAITSP